MELKEILAKCDHTLLAQTATWADIRAICDDGLKYKTASVCIPASFVKQAKDYVGDKLPICTVIGFPNGYDTTAAKCFMASDAVEKPVEVLMKSAPESDTHLHRAIFSSSVRRHVSMMTFRSFPWQLSLMARISRVMSSHFPSLAQPMLMTMSTSSAPFSTAGATFHDVELFAKHVAPHVKIKAAGGISSLEDAEKFIQLGASRLGTSRIVKIAKNLPNDGTY